MPLFIAVSFCVKTRGNIVYRNVHAFFTYQVDDLKLYSTTRMQHLMQTILLYF